MQEFHDCGKPTSGAANRECGVWQALGDVQLAKGTCSRVSNKSRGTGSRNICIATVAVLVSNHS